MTEWRPTAGRKIDRQRLRWEYDVRADLGRMKIQNWSLLQVREAWKGVVDQAVAPREEEQ